MTYATQKWFDYLFRNSSDGLLLLGPDGFIDCNDKAVQLLGLPDKSHILGKGPAAFSPEIQPDGATSEAKAAQMIAATRLRGNSRFEWTHQRQDGRLFQVEVLLTAVEPDGIILVNWRDISERIDSRRVLQWRLAFERLLVDIAVRFINLDLKNLDDGIVHALREIGEFVGADRSNIFLYQEKREVLDHRYEWHSERVGSLLGRLRNVDMRGQTWGWADERLKQGEVVAIANTADLAETHPQTRAFVEGNDAHSFILVPMMERGAIIGLVGFDALEPRRAWTEEEVQLLRIIGEIFVNALQRKRVDEALKRRNEELAALSRRIVAIQESERQAVARELHDETGQTLTALSLQLGQLADQTASSPDVIRQIGDIQQSVNAISAQLHRLASDLRPASLDRQPLSAAIQELAVIFQRRYGVLTRVEADDIVDLRLPTVAKTAVYRIVQEALNNVARHAHATLVDILISTYDDRLKVIVEDDGIGFDLAVVHQSNRLGLLGMRERVEMLGGRFDVESRPSGGGTMIYAEVPYRYESVDRG